MDQVSVVLIPDGSSGDEVRRMLGSWTRAGITLPLLIVRSADVRTGAHEPVQVSAILLEAGGESSVDLFTFLGRHRIDLIRIVLTQLLPHPGAGDPALTTLAETVAEAIQATLPLDPSGHPITQLHRSVVLVPATGVNGVDPALLLPRWNANIVISPEDRPDVDRPSVFVRAAANFAGHAAAAVAAAAGVVRGVSAGAFDEITNDSSTNPDDVVVARVSVRSVVGEDFLDALTRRALGPDPLAPHDPAHVLTWANQASDPDLLLDRAASTVLRSPEWASSPEPEEASADPRVTRASRGIAGAARFNLRTTAAVAAWTFSRGRDYADSVATGAIVGADSGWLVTIGPRVADHVDSVAADVIGTRRQSLDERIRYEGTRATPLPPTTWSELRQLAFALVDGSSIPGMDQPQQLGKREILLPDEVAPNPDDPFVSSDDARIEPTDLPAIDAQQATLTERRERARHDVRQAESSLQAMRAKLPAPSDDAEDTPDPAAEAEIASLEQDATRRRTDLERIEKEADDFGAWQARVLSSLLGRVGQSVFERLTRHEDDRQRFSDRRDDLTAPVEQRLKAAKDRLLRRWWWSIPLALLVIAAVMLHTFFIQDEPQWGRSIGIIAVVIVVTALFLLLSNHRFYKEVRRYERELALVLTRQHYETERYLWDSKELLRLRSLYTGWRDWTALIGEVLHRPWEAPRATYEALPGEVIEHLPAAVAIAQQEETHIELPQSLVVKAVRDLYSPGWATQAFVDAYEVIAPQFSVDRPSGYLDVDADTRSSEFTPRGQLLSFWQSGDARRRLGADKAAQLRDLTREGALGLPERQVQRIGRFSDGRAVPESEYFAPTTTQSTTLALDIFGSRSRSEDAHYVRRSWIWLPLGARTQATPPANAGGVTADPVTMSSATAATSLRIDISRRIAPSLLNLFNQEPPGTDDDSAQNGHDRTPAGTRETDDAPSRKDGFV